MWCNSPEWAKASSLSRPHNHTEDTPNSIGLLSTSDRPITGLLPDKIQYLQENNNHAPGGIRTHNPGKRAAADTLLRRRGHWDRHKIVNTLRYFASFIWMECKVGDGGPSGPYRLKARMR